MSRKLPELIKERIKRKGPIPLDEYMNLCLYHPQFGYYFQARKTRWGKKGDYFTGVSVGETFGQLLTLALVRLVKKTPYTSQLTFIELGAGQGNLALDILKNLKKYFPDYYLKTTYWAVEQNPKLRELIKSQAEKIQENKIKVPKNLKEVEEIKSGIVLANELIDSLPVKQIKMTSKGPFELFVGLKNNRLVTFYQPTRAPEVINYLKKRPLKTGQVKEINFFAQKILAELALKLKSGFLVLLDYGGLEEEILTKNPEGTLRGFYQHRLTSKLTFKPGEADLTSDVNFSDLIEGAKELGFEIVDYQSELNFFAPLVTELISRTNPEIQQKIQNHLKILIHPSFMGERFKVLTLKRDCAKSR